MNAVCNHLERRDRIALNINHFLSATSLAIQISSTFLHFLHGSRKKVKSYLIGKYPERLLKKSTCKLDLFQDVCVVIVYGVRHVDATVEVTAVTQNYFARVSLETRRRNNLFYFLQIPRASGNE